MPVGFSRFVFGFAADVLHCGCGVRSLRFDDAERCKKHTYPSSAKLSGRRGEFGTGWAAANAELRSLRKRGLDHDRWQVLRRARPWLHRDEARIPASAKGDVAYAFACSPRLVVLIEVRERIGVGAATLLACGILGAVLDAEMWGMSLDRRWSVLIQPDQALANGLPHECGQVGQAQLCGRASRRK